MRKEGNVSAGDKGDFTFDQREDKPTLAQNDGVLGCELTPRKIGVLTRLAQR